MLQKLHFFLNFFLCFMHFKCLLHLLTPLVLKSVWWKCLCVEALCFRLPVCPPPSQLHLNARLSVRAVALVNVFTLMNGDQIPHHALDLCPILGSPSLKPPCVSARLSRFSFFFLFFFFLFSNSSFS